MERADTSDQKLATWIATILGGILERGKDLHMDELPDDVAPDLIVLGQQNVRNELLDSCMAAAHARTRFLPQEGFVDFVLFGFDWWTDSLVSYLDHACSYYPGLAYIRENASANDFEWPTVERTPVVEPRGPDEKHRAEQTELNIRGYNVARDGPSRDERWRLLRTIIDGREMTLKDVAGTIASLCRARRRQYDGEQKFARALQEWEYDLGQLKAAYYDRGRHQWAWPSVRP